MWTDIYVYIARTCICLSVDYRSRPNGNVVAGAAAAHTACLPACLTVPMQWRALFFALSLHFEWIIYKIEMYVVRTAPTDWNENCTVFFCVILLLCFLHLSHWFFLSLSFCLELVKEIARCGRFFLMAWLIFAIAIFTADCIVAALAHRIKIQNKKEKKNNQLEILLYAQMHVR